MPNNDENADSAEAAGSRNFDLSRFPEWEPSSAVAANWSRGIALNEAWFDCLADSGRQQYRNEKNDSRRWSIRSDIQFEIEDALLNEQLIAFGAAETETTNPALVKLDAFLFRPRVCQIDWLEGCVDSLGKRFVGVHILKNCEILASPVSEVSPDIRQREGTRKRGRKSLSPLLAESARQVARLDPLFRGRIQEKQVNEIRLAAKELAPGHFTGAAMPGRSTVARFVQAQRESGWPSLADPDNPANPE